VRFTIQHAFADVTICSSDSSYLLQSYSCSH
jgi:hypothetical protein